MTGNDGSVLRLYWHDDCMLHDPGEGVFESAPSPYLAVQEPHPETDVRVLNIKSMLETGPLKDRIEVRTGRHATDDEVTTFHGPEYLAYVKASAEAPEPVRIDGSSTVVARDSFKAAMAAAGTTLDALEDVMNNPGVPAFALVRPPGHHAQPTMGDGNCIFNNVGIAVLAALDRGAARVAVVDWDVHHGNGTQEGFYDRSDVMTISLHMDHGSWGPNHLQTGKADEIGVGPGVGFNRNIPLPFGVGDRCYEAAMTELVTPLIDDFRPDVLIVAAGEDANAFDPNGRQLVSMAGFRVLGGIARGLAGSHCEGRLLLVQEGGYAPTYTAFSAQGMVEGVLGLRQGLIEDPIGYYVEIPEYGLAALPKIREAWDGAIGNAG